MATQTQFSPTYNTIGTMQTAYVPDKERIPLVGHIITDEDIGALQGSKMQPINLHRVVKLLTDPHSASLYDRHIHALRKVIKHYRKGFIMRELVQVFKILNVAADRIEDQPMYTEPVIEILKICGLPYLKEKMSDETAFEQIAIESVSQLGYLMRVPNIEVRQIICNTLINFYSEKTAKQDVQRLQASNIAYNQKIVEASDVSETLVKSLALVDAELEIRQAVMNVLQRLSKTSQKNCDRMLKADAAHRICTRLMDPDPSGQTLFRSIDILWNLLENGSTEEVAAQLNNLTCISQLRDAFIQQLTQGYSHYDRQLRNDILLISSIVASILPDAPFVEIGFVKQLTLFATFQEVKSHNALVKHLKLTQTHEDFELRKLLINILVILSRDSSVLPILSEGHLLLALFSFVRNNENDTGPQELTPAKFEELQLHALASLCTLAPVMMEDYMTCQGSTRILLLLEWCTSADDYKGHGNSFHGKGGRDNKRAQMRHCLRLMRNMVSTGNENILQDFVDQGAINQLTNILSAMVVDRKGEDEVDVDMQTDMLFVLSSLCETDIHRKELFGNQGVDVVIAYLKTDIKLMHSGLGHHKLMLAAVDTVWCTVVGCFGTEDYFLEKAGVFLLIDLLELSPKNMHNLILGCLLDLCENSKTMHHVTTWRGKDSQSAAHLFCELWRREESDMGVSRESSGTIADSAKPLMGTLQEEQGIIPLPANCPSQAIVDVSENMRAKIYSLFGKIGFMELSGLNTEDHVTLTIIEHYLDFKVGEVWSEFTNELEQEEIRPVTPDQEAIEAITRTVNDLTLNVVQTQQELLEAQNQRDLLDEHEYFAEIRENHRQKERAILHFNDFVSRTSNYGLLKAAKERQELSVDASRVQDGFSEMYHNTELLNIQFTAYSGRHVNVESTPALLTGGLLSTYDPTTGTLRSRNVNNSLEMA